MANIIVQIYIYIYISIYLYLYIYICAIFNRLLRVEDAKQKSLFQMRVDFASNQTKQVTYLNNKALQVSFYQYSLNYLPFLPKTFL